MPDAPTATLPAALADVPGGLASMHPAVGPRQCGHPGAGVQPGRRHPQPSRRVLADRGRHHPAVTAHDLSPDEQDMHALAVEYGQRLR